MENGSIKFVRNEIPTAEFRSTTKQLFGTGPVWTIDVPFGAAPSTPLHQLVLENFADSILNGTDLVAPAEEGLNSVELANSMLFSSMQGETVNLPLDGDAYETMLKGLIANSGFKKETASGAVAADMSASFGK